MHLAHVDCVSHDIFEELVLIIGVVRGQTGDHFKQNDTEKVPVYSLAVAVFLQHLRGQIGIAPAETLGADFASPHVLSRQAEISQHRMPAFVYYHIIRFQVAENDILLVQGLDSE